MVYFLVYFFILLSDGRRGGIKLKGRKEGKGAAKKMFFKFAVFWILFGSENGGSKMAFKSPYSFSRRRYEHICVLRILGLCGRVSSGFVDFRSVGRTHYDTKTDG